MRIAIEGFNERKLALMKHAQEIAKEVFFKEADVKKLVSRSTLKAEYENVTRMIIQKLIDDGVISDLLELAHAFGRRINGQR